MPSEPIIETQVSPPAISVFRYVVDLAFAVVVFASLLGVIWVLYLWSSALRMPRLLFVIRFAELAIVAFVTFCCVVSALNATIVFAKKLLRKPQEPTEQVPDEKPSLHLRYIGKCLWSTAGRFRDPLRRWRGWLAICSGIVFVLLYVGVSFGELVRDNCDDVSIWACELMCETGPYFNAPIDQNDFETVLQSYAQYVDERHLSVLLRFFPKYSPKRVLADVSEAMATANGSHEEIANDIWRTGEEVMLFRLHTPKFLPRQIMLHEYRRTPKSLFSLAAEALEDSNTASVQFNKMPTMENAVHSCERNRITMILLFPLRLSCHDPKVTSLFDRFREIVDECRTSKIDAAGRITNVNDPRKEFLENIIARSELRRLGIIGDIGEKRNMQRAIEQMWDAIETANRERAHLLELCTEIRNAGNYSKKI